MTSPLPSGPDAAALLASRILELERERERLLTIIDILQELAGTLHFVDILQTIARRLGETFGLDRSSIFLAERGGRTVRLVASYEDPSIRNLVVDLARYPEIERAMQTGETVFIADATADQSLKHVKGALARRKVKSITVVPIKYRGAAIGCIFLRTFKDGETLSEADIRFTQTVADLTAKALRNAHRYESLLKRTKGQPSEGTASHGAELQRAALITYLQRLLDAFAGRDRAALEQLLPDASAAELQRLVGVTMAVLAEEAKG
ncbi:MAG TPA: GAF domain-containing protein [Gemmatimonadales bacterium]|nr:GAF domain-containing protein [Gemmatimonadales bacterium]